MKYVFLTFFGVLMMSHIAFAGHVVDLPGYAFKYSATTKASKVRLWKVWSDIPGWALFDERLKYSKITGDGAFKDGAKGFLKGKGAPRTAFTIVDVKDGVSFTQRLHLPLYQKIDLKRYYTVHDDGTLTFTHEVEFKGSFRGLYFALLSKAFKKDLVQVVDALKLHVEQKQD